jgi:hypothetical protein
MYRWWYLIFNFCQLVLTFQACVREKASQIVLSVQTIFLRFSKIRGNHCCNGITKKKIGELVRLIGWIQSIRGQDGLIRVDFCERKGILRSFFESENDVYTSWLPIFNEESVIDISRTLRTRPDDMDNQHAATGKSKLQPAHSKFLVSPKLCDVSWTRVRPKK